MFPRSEVVDRYRKLVHKLAKMFSAHGQKQEDLVQEGYCGLLEAYDRFDADRGTQFMTYAYLRVFARMQAATEKVRYPVYCSHTLQTKLRQQETLPITSVPYEDELTALSTSIDQQLDNRIVQEVFRLLPEKEQYIVYQRVIHEKKFCDLAEEFGHSRQAVYQIYANAIQFLKKKIELRLARSPRL